MRDRLDVAAFFRPIDRPGSQILGDPEFDLIVEERSSDGEESFRSQARSTEIAGNGEIAEDSSKELRREEGDHRRKWRVEEGREWKRTWTRRARSAEQEEG